MANAKINLAQFLRDAQVATLGEKLFFSEVSRLLAKTSRPSHFYETMVETHLLPSEQMKALAAEYGLQLVESDTGKVYLSWAKKKEASAS